MLKSISKIRKYHNLKIITSSFFFAILMFSSNSLSAQAIDTSNQEKLWLKQYANSTILTSVADLFEYTGDGFVVAAAGQMYYLLTDPEINTVDEVNAKIEKMGDYLIVALACKTVALLIKLPAKIQQSALLHKAAKN